MEAVDGSRMKAVYPVIVTLQDLVLRAPLSDWLHEIIKGEMLLSQKGVRPVQFLDVREAEQLGMSVKDGLDLRVILEKKLSDAWGRKESFTNYTHARNIGVPAELHDAELERRFQELSQQATAFFASYAQRAK